MIWAILFATIFMMLGGDAGLVKDLSKPVKQHVQDEAKVKEILALNEAMMKEEAAFSKGVKEARKTLAKLNRDRLTSAEELQAVFTTLQKQRAETREKMVDDLFRMKALMTADEWSRVFADQPGE